MAVNSPLVQEQSYLDDVTRMHIYMSSRMSVPKLVLSSQFLDLTSSTSMKCTAVLAALAAIAITPVNGGPIAYGICQTGAYMRRVSPSRELTRTYQAATRSLSLATRLQASSSVP